MIAAPAPLVSILAPVKDEEAATFVSGGLIALRDPAPGA